jgi:RHS repeat-associated protein
VKAFLTAPVSEDGCGLSPTQAEPYLRAVALATTIQKVNGHPSNRLGTVTLGGIIKGVATGIPRSTKEINYDLNGNLTGDGTFLYEYDPLNRQSVVRQQSDSALVAQYFYDSAGERIAAIRYAGGLESDYTLYLRDGPSVIFEKSWTLPDFSPKVEKTYIYAPGGMAVTRQTAYLPGPATATFSYYAVDHLGTVRGAVTVDAGGTETSRSVHDYEPYGIEIPPLQASVNTHRFTGQERDVETENDYMHYRFYGSNMGRFMKPDSIMGDPRNPQSWNLYSYVHGNPVNFNDPTGHVAKLTEEERKKLAEQSMKDLTGGMSGGHLENPDDHDPTILGAKTGVPAPTNSDDSAKPPTDDVPKLPEGKGPNGDLVPNEWVQGKGTGDWPVRWDPKYPIPGQSPPNVSWDPNGHWDYNDGKGNRTRWLPGRGGQVDHWNNPIHQMTTWDRLKSIPPAWVVGGGTTAIVIYLIVSEGSRLYPPRNLVPIP